MSGTWVVWTYATERNHQGSDLVAGRDYEESCCPSCGDPECTFPPECQDSVFAPPLEEE